jgi:hypothetical protein
MTLMTLGSVYQTAKVFHQVLRMKKQPKQQPIQRVEIDCTEYLQFPIADGYYNLVPTNGCDSTEITE